MLQRLIPPSSRVFFVQVPSLTAALTNSYVLNWTWQSAVRPRTALLRAQIQLTLGTTNSLLNILWGVMFSPGSADFNNLKPSESQTKVQLKCFPSDCLQFVHCCFFTANQWSLFSTEFGFSRTVWLTNMVPAWCHRLMESVAHLMITGILHTG